MDCLELMEGIDYEVLQEGNPHRTVMGIEYDSRRIRRGYVFVCLRGTVESGVHFLKQAACDGAIMAVTQEAPVEIPEGLRVLLVEDVMRVMPVMASTYYHNPSQDLYLGPMERPRRRRLCTTFFSTRARRRLWLGPLKIELEPCGCRRTIRRRRHWTYRGYFVKCRTRA